MLSCHTAVMADVHRVKAMGIKSVPSFLGCHTSYFRSLKYLLSIPIIRFLVPFCQIKNLVNLISLKISISPSENSITRSSQFQCLKWKEFLAEFSIFIEKDLEEIHPQCFSHTCCTHTDRRSVFPVIWVSSMMIIAESVHMHK